MKRLLATLFLLLASSGLAQAQFRNQLGPAADEKLNTLDAMKGSGDSFLSTIFDPARFSMHQSYSMSFVSGGGGSTGLSMFTNTFSYKASNDLFISADVSATYSPFSSFGSDYAKSLNGIYLTNARLDWRLGENTFMRVEYLGGPANGMYGGGYNPFYNPYSAPSPFTATPSVAPKFPGH